MDTLERNLAEQVGVSRYRWKEGYFCRGYGMRTGGVHKTSRFSTWVQDPRCRDAGMTFLKLQFVLSDRHMAGKDGRRSGASWGWPQCQGQRLASPDSLWHWETT